MKRAFDHFAHEYARYRPGYPPELLATLTDAFGAPNGRIAADVGAGSGIFSRSLAGTGWRVIAIEPSLPMLQQLLSRPDAGAPRDNIALLVASAEATALADHSVDLVTAAQAFHWFNPPHALAEFARILKPDGGLALIWNDRDLAASEFLQRYETLVESYNPAYRREYRRQDWPAKIAQAQHFAPTESFEFPWTWSLPPDDFVGFARSCSYIRNVLSREALPHFETDLRNLIATTFKPGPCHVPIQTRMWLTRRNT